MLQLDRIARAEFNKWDLDGTLTVNTQALMNSCNEAVALAALSLGVPLDMEEAKVLAARSYEEHRFSARVFIDQYGQDLGFGWHEMSPLYHDRLIELDRARDLIPFNPELREAFRASGRKHYVNTHASGAWARYIVGKLRIAPHISGIIAHEDTGYAMKCSSDVPVMHSLAMAGLETRNASRAAFIEDTPRNLRHPKLIGMNTALIAAEGPPEKFPEYVDAVYESAAAFLMFQNDYKPRAERTYGIPACG